MRLLFEHLKKLEAGIICNLGRSQSNKDILLRPLSGGQPIERSGTQEFNRTGWPQTVRDAVQGMVAGMQPMVATLIDGWFLEPLGKCRPALFLYGAGHVGRAVVHAFDSLPFEIYWVDTNSERFPRLIPRGVNQLIADNPADAVQHAPSGSWHVVMTFSHALDFDVCRAVLKRQDFAYAGVIASKTKRARFMRQLHGVGLSERLIARLHAPIGLNQLSVKEPAEIAVSLAADLLLRLNNTANVEPIKTDAALVQGIE